MMKVINCLTLIVAVTLFLSGTLATKVSAANGGQHVQTTALLLSTLPNGRFEVEYKEEVHPSGERLPIRIFSVSLLKGDRKNVLKLIRVPDELLSVFRLADNNNFVFTTWITGSAYRVRVFKLARTGVAEVFDKGAKNLPGFVSIDGTAAILFEGKSSNNEWTEYVASNGKFSEGRPIILSDRPN